MVKNRSRKTKINKACVRVSVFVGAIIAILMFIPTAKKVNGYTLDCMVIDGGSIFGYDGYSYKFIGAIANKFDINSIANEYGAGNRIQADSILSEIGIFGSKISPYSALNEIAVNPPIIIDNNYKFIGYLTVNQLKPLSVNTYNAIDCAQKSHIMSNENMKDIILKDIPQYSSSILSDPSIEERNNQLNQIQKEIDKIINSSNNVNKNVQIEQDKFVNSLTDCPKNSILKNNICICSEGYVWDQDQINCIRIKFQPVGLYTTTTKTEQAPTNIIAIKNSQVTIPVKKQELVKTPDIQLSKTFEGNDTIIVKQNFFAKLISFIKNSFFSFWK